MMMFHYDQKQFGKLRKFVKTFSPKRIPIYFDHLIKKMSTRSSKVVSRAAATSYVSLATLLKQERMDNHMTDQNNGNVSEIDLDVETGDNTYDDWCGGMKYLDDDPGDYEDLPEAQARRADEEAQKFAEQSEQKFQTLGKSRKIEVHLTVELSEHPNWIEWDRKWNKYKKGLDECMLQIAYQIGADVFLRRDKVQQYVIRPPKAVDQRIPLSVKTAWDDGGNSLDLIQVFDSNEEKSASYGLESGFCEDMINGYRIQSNERYRLSPNSKDGVE